ncbi:hypothetical protein CWB72_08150 [Pseudoalteromonas phenolica]|uniref:hypothetical protein n=1 Tax=Pseudoalteromonas phenolica TaxID=161398 RepID=UPI00110B08B4|nr:hypothetical protein [Pseudoalteromonas phenolica]TMN90854.1 hypothetical protein CWB72_08150 [Pseudoalteromonas phenolica]
MKFKAHGLWRVHIENATIYIALKGGFNREGVIDFQNDIIKRVMSEPTPCDSAVLNLSEFEMSTSDSLEATKEYFEGVKQRGYKWVDYIGVNPIAEHLLKQLWQGAKTQLSFYPDEQTYLAHKPEHQQALAVLSQIRFEHPH